MAWILSIASSHLAAEKTAPAGSRGRSRRNTHRARCFGDGGVGRLGRTATGSPRETVRPLGGGVEGYVGWSTLQIATVLVSRRSTPELAFSRSFREVLTFLRHLRSARSSYAREHQLGWSYARCRIQKLPNSRLQIAQRSTYRPSLRRDKRGVSKWCCACAPLSAALQFFCLFIFCNGQAGNCQCSFYEWQIRIFWHIDRCGSSRCVRDEP